MRLTEPQFNEILKNGHCKIAQDSHSGSNANSKPAPVNDKMGEKKGPRFDGQVCIIIKHYRHKLADTWGCSEKYAIDAIVDRGILRNDTTKEISEENSKQIQIKIPAGEPERTEIEIKEVE